MLLEKAHKMSNSKFDQITYAGLNINRPLKRLIVICVDISLCALTVWLSFYLRLGEFVPFSSFVMGPVIASTLFAIPIFKIVSRNLSLQRIACHQCFGLCHASIWLFLLHYLSSMASKAYPEQLD